MKLFVMELIYYIVVKAFKHLGNEYSIGDTIAITEKDEENFYIRQHNGRNRYSTSIEQKQFFKHCTKKSPNLT